MTKIEKIRHGTGSSKWPFVVVRMPRGLFVRVKVLAKSIGTSRSVIVLRMLERGLRDATRLREAPKRTAPRKAKKTRAKSHASTRTQAKKPTINGAQAGVQ